MESVFRGAAVYFILLMILRLSGRRSVAQMTPFDLVLLLIIAETTQQALLGDDFSIINAALLIIVLFRASGKFRESLGDSLEGGFRGAMGQEVIRCPTAIL